MESLFGLLSILDDCSQEAKMKSMNILMNLPPRNGEGIIGMPFICLLVCPSVTLSCLLHISLTLLKIFIWSNVHLGELVCRNYDTATQSRSKFTIKGHVIFMSALYLLEP